MNIAILSGEMSGDLTGAALAEALHRLNPDISLWGLGSRRMAEAGVELLHDSAQWGTIGIVEALKVYPLLRYSIYPHTRQEIALRRPSAVVLIDFGAFNVRLARDCKAMGVPVLYYFPPGSWRKNGRASDELARITDRIATPFPWSAERLRSVGANVEFVGHPLLDLTHPTLTRSRFAGQLGMDPTRPIIGLLPGSRNFEVQYNTPAMIGAAQIISEQIPTAQFVFGLAPNVKAENIADMIRSQLQETKEDTPEKPAERTPRERGLTTPEGFTLSGRALEDVERARRAPIKTDKFTPPMVIAQDLTRDVLAHSDALIICSGTATLEAAILGTPMVIIYRGSRLMNLERHLRRIRPEHIGMPNILVGERIVPELIQEEATPEALAEAVLHLLRDPGDRAKMKSDLARARAVLGEPGASDRTAAMVMEMIR